MARRSLKPQLNQIRTWVRQGRTDAWIAHQLDVSVKDISAFKRSTSSRPPTRAALRATCSGPASTRTSPTCEPRTRRWWRPPSRPRATATARTRTTGSEGAGDANGDEDEDGKPRRRRRGRRGGRGRGEARKALDGTFDHGEEGYGLWLDPAVQDDPVYAEHWAGHRPVTATIEPDRIVITRTGEDAGDGDDS